MSRRLWTAEVRSTTDMDGTALTIIRITCSGWNMVARTVAGYAATPEDRQLAFVEQIEHMHAWRRPGHPTLPPPLSAWQHMDHPSEDASRFEATEVRP